MTKLYSWDLKQQNSDRMDLKKFKGPKAKPKFVVNGAHAFVLQISRFFGLAPLSFERTAGGWSVDISIPMCIYSFILGTALVSLTLFGMIRELMVGTKVSVRMSTRIGQIVSVADIMVVVITAACGIYGAPRRMKRILKIMDIVSSVDTCLGVDYSVSKERNYCIGVLALLICFTCLLIDDFCLYVNLAKHNNRIYDLIENYTAFYLLYYVVFILELQFTYTAWAIKQRLVHVNEALEHVADAVKNDAKVMTKDKQRSALNAIAVTVLPAPENKLSQPPVNRIGLIVDSLNQFPHPELLMTKKVGDSGSRHLLVTPTDAIRKLSDLHGNIATAVHYANLAYGHPLLIVLVGTLLHLIVTPYFLILELGASTFRIHYTILQFLWCFTHATRLFMVVEPCHLTSNEGRKTVSVSCQMLGYLYNDCGGSAGIHQAVDILSRQVTMRSLDFTALGVCIMGRPLIAAVAGAVTTYLVILIQFQKDDRK